MGSPHKVTHSGVEFQSPPRGIKEIGCELDSSGFEKGHRRRSTECEETFFLPFVDVLIREVGLVNTAHIGRTEFDDGYQPQARRRHFRDHSLVLPEVIELLAKGERADGVERAIDEGRGAGEASSGKMKTMVVGGAETGENGASAVVAGGPVSGLKQLNQIKLLALDEDAGSGRKIVEAQVSSVCRKTSLGRVGIHRARSRPEAAGKKIVEIPVGFNGIGEVIRVDAVSLDEWLDPVSGGGAIHTPSVERGKKGALDEQAHREATQRVPVGPTKESFAIDGFRLNPLGVAVEELDRREFQERELGADLGRG